MRNILSLFFGILLYCSFFSFADDVGRLPKDNEKYAVIKSRMFAPILERYAESKTWARFVKEGDYLEVVRVGENWIQVKNDKAPYQTGWIDINKVVLRSSPPSNLKTVIIFALILLVGITLAVSKLRSK